MKTKKCSNPKCQQPEKPISEFGKDKSRKDGLNVYCKDCCKKQQKEFRDIPENKQKLKNKVIEHRKQFPWKATLKYIKNRCEQTSNICYEDYGGKGIECRITESEGNL